MVYIGWFGLCRCQLSFLVCGVCAAELVCLRCIVLLYSAFARSFLGMFVIWLSFCFTLLGFWLFESYGLFVCLLVLVGIVRLCCWLLLEVPGFTWIFCCLGCLRVCVIVGYVSI